MIYKYGKHWIANRRGSHKCPSFQQQIEWAKWAKKRQERLD